MPGPQWFIFGDSLSDDGATQGVLTGPSTDPFGGRASNGALWHELIRDDLLVAPGATQLGQAPEVDGSLGGSLDNGVNFAHGGARSSINAGGSSVPGALEQAQGFATLVNDGTIPAPTPDDLFIVLVGGNDVVDDLVGSNGIINVAEIVGNIRSTLETLQAAGMERLFLGGVPSLGGLFLGAEASQLPPGTVPFVNSQIATLNDQIEALAVEFADDGIDTFFFDTAAFVATIEADPAAFGYDHIDSDAFTDGFDIFNVPDDYFSVDGLHPTDDGHQTIAEAVIAATDAAGFSLALPPDLTGTGAGDTLTGTSGDDSMQGFGGNDVIDGGDGNDDINAGGGFDTVTGGTGNDTITAANGFDSVEGGLGDDLISGNNGNDILVGDDGNDTLLGGLGGDTLFGSAGDDLLTGQAGTDVIFGDAGTDTLNGNAGSDTMLGGTGNDLLNGGIADDVLSGDGGNDTVNGGNGSDVISGIDGDDRLSGNAGSDTIAGGIGTDVLLGGIGADTFLFNLGDGNDRIGDFQNNIDTVFLDSDLLTETVPVAEDLRNYSSFNADGHLVLTFGADSLTFTGVFTTTAVLDDVVFI